MTTFFPADGFRRLYSFALVALKNTYLLIQHKVHKGPGIKETVNTMFKTHKKNTVLPHMVRDM